MQFFRGLNIKGEFIFCSFLGLSLLLTFIYKYAIFFYRVHLKYTWVPDIVFMSCILYLIIINKEHRFIKGIIFLLLLKSIGSATIYSFYPEALDFFKEVIKTVISYSFVFMLSYYLGQLRIEQLNKIFSIFKYIAVLVGIFVIIGTLFSIRFFKTYLGERFGYSGLLYPSSFSSYFIIISILIHYFYNKYIETVPKLFFAILVLAGLFIGTKAVYLFLLCFSGFIFVNDRIYKKKYVLGFLVLSLGVVVIYFKPIATFLAKKFEVLNSLYLNFDFITFILSFRNMSLREALTFISNNWSILNYIVGGVNRKEMLVEMELIDLFMSFGFAGCIFFFYAIKKTILKNILVKIDTTVLTGVLVLIIILSGNFLKSFTIAYLTAFLFVILQNSKQCK